MRDLLPRHLPDIVRRPQIKKKTQRRDSGPVEADICLILEATYPYVSGGVSSWVHDLVTSLSDMTFALVCLQTKGMEREHKYEVPDNVVEIADVYLHELPAGRPFFEPRKRFFEALKQPLMAIQAGGGLTDIEALIDLIAPHRSALGEESLMASPRCWQMLQDMYLETQPTSPFLEYFWTWRGLYGPVFAVLLAPLPKCQVYHTVSTGYAGVMAARAAIETGRPTIVTEHGIYTNERRIEITLADWIYESERGTLSLDLALPTLKDMWKNSFLTYSSACYQASTTIYTIYGGNQRLQLADGADPAKMTVIPNGIDLDRFSSLERSADNPRPTIALVGRVVTIKDIKTFIRACGVLQTQILDLQAWIMGPTDEEEDYYQECVDLVRQEGLESVVSFTGRVNLVDYFPHIDVVVLTSISEGQPLVLLEAGAAGIPCVATDVGACWELIMGRSDEDPQLGPGGVVTSLSSPAATADGIRRLLQDRDFYTACSVAMRERTRIYYNKRDMVDAYRAAYRDHMALPDRRPAAEAA